MIPVNSSRKLKVISLLADDQGALSEGARSNILAFTGETPLNAHPDSVTLEGTGVPEVGL